MADYGRQILGTYSAACEVLRSSMEQVSNPKVGDIVFFSGTRHSGANHIALIYKVESSTIYTVEGNTSGSSGVVDNGGEVATKSYLTTYYRILSFARPKYTTGCPASDVIDVAMKEVGYVEKASNNDLDSKTGNVGKSNFTKYGQWMGANGDYWCASFISWCFHVAYDDSSTEIGSLVDTDDDDSSPIRVSTTANSSLVSYINRTSDPDGKIRTKDVECITVHIARSRGDITQLAELINSGSKSYNYGIDTDGIIGIFADELIATPSSNNKKNDNRAVNIVCMNESLSPNYSLSDATYNALVELSADICRRNYIPFLYYTNNPKEDTLTLHSDFNPKSDCPGPWFTKRIKTFIKDVNKAIQKQWSQSNARIAQSEEAALYIQSSINIDAIKPYVIAPDQNQLGVDYSKMRDMGVVGVMLDGGMRFNKKHELVDYRSANIYKQCEEVKKAKLPFGIYYTSHAQDVDDAREECYWLYFIISKYPPKLGVWLHCDFDEDLPTARAMSIVEKYYSSFVQWGLKSKCGLYATKKQAKLINWPRQCTYMPLWLEGEMTDAVCPEDEILTPSFFQLSSLENKGYNKKTDSVPSMPFPTDVADYTSQSTNDSYYTKPATSSSRPGVLKVKKYSDGSEGVMMPDAPKYTGFKKYEPHHLVTSVSTLNYKLCRVESTTDANGFRKLDGRYLVAVGAGVTSVIGTYVDVILANGTVIKCIVGDAKDPEHTDDDTGEVYTSVTPIWCCSEFIVDVTKLDPTVKKMGDCSWLKDAWKSPVVEIRVYAKNWDNKKK